MKHPDFNIVEVQLQLPYFADSKSVLIGFAPVQLLDSHHGSLDIEFEKY